MKYIGNKISQVNIDNGAHFLAFSSSQYNQNAVKNVEDYLQKKGDKFKTLAESPWSSNYRKETYLSTEL